MRALSSDDVVRLWEEGEALAPIEQALLVLGRALPERSLSELRDLPLGQRNGLLLEVRAATFGDSLRGSTPCRICQTDLEFSLSARVLLASAEGAQEELFELRTPELEARIRLVRSADVLGVLGLPAAERAPRLLERCVLALSKGGAACSVSQLSDAERAQLTAAIAERDPLAEVQLNVVCPDCRAETPVHIDIAAYFWAELLHHAQSLLRDVQILARAFGWREPDVLALSPRRRRLYTEAAGR